MEWIKKSFSNEIIVGIKILCLKILWIIKFMFELAFKNNSSLNFSYTLTFSLFLKRDNPI